MKRYKSIFTLLAAVTAIVSCGNSVSSDSKLSTFKNADDTKTLVAVSVKEGICAATLGSEYEDVEIITPLPIKKNQFRRILRSQTYLSASAFQAAMLGVAVINPYPLGIYAFSVGTVAASAMYPVIVLGEENAESFIGFLAGPALERYKRGKRLEALLSEQKSSLGGYRLNIALKELSEAKGKNGTCKPADFGALLENLHKMPAS